MLEHNNWKSLIDEQYHVDVLKTLFTTCRPLPQGFFLSDSYFIPDETITRQSMWCQGALGPVIGSTVSIPPSNGFSQMGEVRLNSQQSEGVDHILASDDNSGGGGGVGSGSSNCGGSVDDDEARPCTCMLTHVHGHVCVGTCMCAHVH